MEDEMSDVINPLDNAGLSDRERDVLKLRLGVDTGKKMTIDAVGELFGVNANEIRKIELNAIEKIKKFYENK